MGDPLASDSVAIVWLFLSAGLGLVVILIGLGIALVVYQRRFLAMHRSYAEGLLKAQESERAWVAREVHDDALQRIMLLQHELDDWREQSADSPQLNAKRAGALRIELEELSTMLRRLAYRLHPVFVDQEGIASSLQRLASDMEHVGRIQVEIRDGMPPGLALTPEQSLTVYRIAQEALTNVVRHAHCDRATVALSRQNGSLAVRIEDFGTGFDPGAGRPAGLGLTSMTERARSAGGMLLVESYPGGGTRVHLTLPIGPAA